MVIDFEHHYIPEALGRRLGMDPTKKEAVRTRDATVHSQLFDLQAQIGDMDRAGVDIAVQSCILGWDTSLENCRLLNDCTTQLQKDYPGRFAGLAHAPVLEKGGPSTIRLAAVDPNLGSLRGEPRFQVMIAAAYERLGIEPIEAIPAAT